MGRVRSWDMLLRRTVLMGGAAALMGACKLRARTEAPRLGRAPDFDLPNQLGGRTVLSQMLTHGPALVVFYRGRW